MYTIDAVANPPSTDTATNLVSSKTTGNIFSKLPKDTDFAFQDKTILTAFYKSILTKLGVSDEKMNIRLRLTTAANLPNANSIDTASIVLDGFVRDKPATPIAEVLLFNSQPWMNGRTPTRITMHMISKKQELYNQTLYGEALLTFAKIGLANVTTKKALENATKADGTHEMPTESMKVMKAALEAFPTEDERLNIILQLLISASSRDDYTVLSLLLINDANINRFARLKALLLKVKPDFISNLKGLFIEFGSNPETAIYNVEDLTNGLHDTTPLDVMAQNAIINDEPNSSRIWPILFENLVSFFVSAGNVTNDQNLTLTDAPAVDPAILFSYIRSLTEFDRKSGKKLNVGTQMVFSFDAVVAAFALTEERALQYLKAGNRGIN